MTSSLDQEFGSVRALLWPIHHYELRKLVPMLLMLFLVCFCYSILRNMKDSLVVTASGAEVIPFIKVWVMLPTAVFLTWIFTHLSNKYSQERVFYIMITLFLSFFALFAFVLYPLRELLHPKEFTAYLRTILPVGFKGLIDMFSHWTFTAFYVMSELWSTSILTILFWGFANEVTSVTEARRFYGVLGVGASCAAIFAGLFANYLSFGAVFNAAFPFGTNAWEQTLILLIIIVIFSGLLTMAIFRWMSCRVLTDASFDAFHYAKKARKAKGQLSFKESFTYLANSKYLLCIAVVVVAYNLVIHMSEVVWKDRLALLYPLPADYNMYMNNLTAMIGLCATLTALFVPKIIDRLGWTGTAAITPIMMTLTCTGFFSFLFFQEDWNATLTLLTGTTPLAIAVFFGSMQNCLSKAAKYSVFDATREMSFIPLEHDYKLKGKAVIDGVGSRVGKSGGAFLLQGLIMVCGSVAASAPWVATILAIVIGFWIIAIRSLGIQFNALVSQQAAQAESIPATPATPAWPATAEPTAATQ